MLEGWAFGAGSGYRAATEVCRYIKDGTLAGRPVKGAFISFVVGRDNWSYDECFAAVDVFGAALSPVDYQLIFSWIPARDDDTDFLGVTALVTV